MRFALSLLLLSSAMLVSSRLRADCKPGASRIELRIEGASDELSRTLRDELTSELERGKLCVRGDGGETPLARIEIQVRDDREVRIQIVDAVTRKTVERQLSVGELPADSRALSIAISADELLRASWAETALRPPQAALPEAVRAAVEPAMRREAETFVRPTSLLLRGMVTLYSGGQSQLGAALTLGRDLGTRVTLELSAYGRRALPTTTAHGAVEASTAGGEVALSLHALRRGPLRLGPQLAMEAGYLQFTGLPGEAARGASFAGATCAAEAGLATTVEVAPVRIAFRALGVVPVCRLHALDGAQTVTSVSGVGFTGGVGAGVAF